MFDLETEIELRVSAFLADIAKLAQSPSGARNRADSANQGQPSEKDAARASVLRFEGEGEGGAGDSDRDEVVSLRRKRTPAELERMADDFLVFVAENPGRRMEYIARELGHPTHALRREVKKLLRSGKVRMEGQTRASVYFAVES
ncbi:hypothetical protein [Haliangium ochraceum]|uniref:Uncharacterized protein n=1 Tax=Haliangium ochraceum (strain DSM 14365 / JCM 11303 / SMP-2) TaxID=502025 RepID=D0LRW0_HALO1|nr:hypothetical protein [Haliangium ochraceum]ACY19102.1 hypothetical protein Hoch_6636 [Haliangium ochraceum DSM 14365]